MQCYFYHNLQWYRGKIISQGRHRTIRLYDENSKTIITLYDTEIVFEFTGFTLTGYMEIKPNTYESRLIVCTIDRPKDF